MSPVWVLIVFAHAGMMSKGDSNSLTSVDGFASQAACNAAGNAAKALTSGTTKEVRFVCVSKGSR